MAFDLIAAALLISGRWPVFPCAADKRPITQGGFKAATRDPAEIRRLFSRLGAALIGVPTGAASGFFVVDCDCKNGAGGLEWAEKNADAITQNGCFIPPFHLTKSGGLHILFLMPQGRDIRCSASKIAPGVDIRGNGGYVIVPPSPGYTLARESLGVSIKPAPLWLLDAIAPKPAPAPVPRARAPSPRLNGGTRRARYALAAERIAIKTAPDGCKHDRVNRAGFAIGGLVAIGELPEIEAWAGLSEALEHLRHRCEDFQAAQRTLARAFAEGKTKPREAASIYGGRA